MRRFALVITALFALACGSGGSGSPSSPIEGTWVVSNADGVETGQTVTITPDHITMTNGALSPSEGSASFTADGDVITADWYGSTSTFTVKDDGTVVMEQGGMATWNLKKQ